MTKQAKTRKHWTVLAVICLMYGGTQGLGANTLGVYYTPVADDLNILHGDFAMNVTISSFVTGFFSLFVPYLLEKMSYKTMIAIGIFFTFIGLFGMGLTQSVALFNVLGIARGIGIALTTMVSGAAIINQWFEEKNGVAISLATSFSGIAGILFSPLFSWLIANIGWGNTFFVHGLLSLLLCVPVLFLPFTFNPREEGLLPYGGAGKGEELTNETEESIFTAKDIFHVSFISLIGVAFFQTAIVGLNQHFPSYGYSEGMNLELTGILLSGTMLGNMIFKLLTGYLSDRLGSIKAMLIVIVLNSLSLLGLLYWTSTLGLAFNSWLYGSLFGTAVLYVVLPKELYGTKMGNYIYSYMIFFASLALALANVGIGYLYDFTGTYRTAFWLGIGFQLLSAILLWLAVRTRPTQEDKKNAHDIL